VKRSWRTLVCVIALATPAVGQSLGDAAKKERDRLEKLRAAGGNARTLTEHDLATTKGALANDPKADKATGNTGEGSQRAAGAPLPNVPDPAPSKNGEEYWRSRVTAARGRVAAAQRRLDALQAMIRLGQPVRHDANGGLVIYSPTKMKEMADAAAAELTSAQTALDGVLEEGRRSGALPGWLR